MKVLLINGSPHKDGCTFTALEEVARGLACGGVESEIYWVGQKPIAGCIACGECSFTGSCIFKDGVQEVQEKLKTAGGLVLGAPVHYASAAGNALSFFDRLFYSSGSELFTLKAAAAVVSARRAGTTAALDRLQKYFGISNMLTVGSQYWPMVHGNTPQEVKKDEEGMQIMYTLGQNMAWLMQSTQKAALPKPEYDQRKRTNFIR